MKAPPANVRVILLDDHPAVLRQVTQLLPVGFEVVASLSDGAGLLGAAAEHRPDLIILDITLPGASGIELVSQLRQADHTCKVVFLTVHDDADYARAAIAAGAHGYVVKSRLAADLLPALNAVLTCHLFVSPQNPLPRQAP
jgi:DNA-binding NarL/FixJ family response regulator